MNFNGSTLHSLVRSLEVLPFRRLPDLQWWISWWTLTSADSTWCNQKDAEMLKISVTSYNCLYLAHSQKSLATPTLESYVPMLFHTDAIQNISECAERMYWIFPMTFTSKKYVNMNNAHKNSNINTMSTGFKLYCNIPGGLTVALYFVKVELKNVFYIQYMISVKSSLTAETGILGLWSWKSTNKGANTSPPLLEKKY